LQRRDQRETGESATMHRQADSTKEEMQQRAVVTILTAREVAELLRVSEGWVRDHATRKQPRLPMVKLGDHKGSPLRFELDQIKEFVEKWTNRE
ncbi:MAG: helix-turn-helix domain-containing protein, partial [Terriglobia bacterium]